MTKRILTVAAHPDDEVLGPGGTLIRHRQEGDEVYCLILGEGIMSRESGTKKEKDNLLKDAHRAAKLIGFKESHFTHFPDNEFDTVSLLKITKEVERVIATIKPHTIYTHHEYDLNIDHRLTFQAVLTASRPCNSDCPREILTFETLSSTEWQRKGQKTFNPSMYVDVTDFIEKKIEAMRAYTSEIRDYPHPRSADGIRILAQYRGLESGLRFAEAFSVIRKIIKT